MFCSVVGNTWKGNLAVLDPVRFWVFSLSLDMFLMAISARFFLKVGTVMAKKAMLPVTWSMSDVGDTIREPG